MADYERERRVTERAEADQTRPVDPVQRFHREEREVVREDDGERVAQERRILFERIRNVIWTITSLIEILIGLRALLRLIGANPGNGFVDFIYRLSGVFVTPFLGIVDDPRSGSSVLEINSLIAMLVYMLLAWVIVRLIWLIFSVTEPVNT